MDGTGQEKRSIVVDEATIERAARLLSEDAEARQILPLLWRKGDSDTVQRGLFSHFLARCVAALERGQAKP
ncbi:MAG TPA: hypothetical protein VJ747_19075 [Stellaceae bacterium]|nr:hypothetical protein [Stellaceae bacterium]